MEHPPCKGVDSECSEIISRNVLTVERFGRRSRAAATHTELRLIRVEGSHLLELLGVITQVLVQVVGENSPAFALQSSPHAAVVIVPNAVQLLRIGNGERLQQDCVHQREDSGIRADAEG